METLAYYKSLNTPITLTQLGRYLIRLDSEDTPGFESLNEINFLLDKLVEDGLVEEQKGLYWLKESGAEKNSWLSYVRFEKIAQRKINRVRKSLRFLRVLPFLRGLFICGSVARKVSHPNSDIDFMIITKSNRTWTVRFLLTIAVFLLGKKTQDNNKTLNPAYRKNKFCLNHYRASSRLKLEENLRDLYSAQEYVRMVNVFSENRIDRKFFKKNKIWMKKFLPNFNFTKLPLFKLEQGSTVNKIRKASEYMLYGKIGNIIEGLLFSLQSKKIAHNRQSRGISSSNRRIITESDVIMFHLNPRGPKVINIYQNICQKLTFL